MFSVSYSEYMFKYNFTFTPILKPGVHVFTIIMTLVP